MTKSPEKIKQNRPTSPHLSIYKWQISSVLSIGHRMTGVGLFLSLSAIAWWFILWVFSKFNPCYIHLLDHTLVKLILYVTTYAFFYHLCNGMRHLWWDSGRGFAICSVNLSGWIAVASSFILTILFWMWV
jgi:succinate dehydrogenase / fumarate reductase cytochrome b subunit